MLSKFPFDERRRRNVIPSHRFEQRGADRKRDLDSDLVLVHRPARDQLMDRIPRELLTEYVSKVVAIDLISRRVEDRESVASRIVHLISVPFDSCVRGEGVIVLSIRDACTADVARLAAQDEARHVAFGLAHLERHVTEDPSLRARLAAAIERRHVALAHTAGLNAEVFDALILLAAGSWDPAALRRGHAAVVELQQAMDKGRRSRLARLGFDESDAARLSSLHTSNFM